MKVLECSPITESLSSSNNMKKNNSHGFKQQRNKGLSLMYSSGYKKKQRSHPLPKAVVQKEDDLIS